MQCYGAMRDIRDKIGVLHKVITPMSKKKYMKRKEVTSESSESNHDFEHNV